jgi:cyclase
MNKGYGRSARLPPGAGRTARLAAVLLGLGASALSLAAAPAVGTVEAATAGTGLETGPGDAVQVLPLRRDFYMLTVDGVNLGLETGPEGAVVIDPGPASASAELLKTIRQLSTAPIRFVIDTNADADLTGGNATLSAAGLSMMIGWQILTRNHNRSDTIQDHPLDTRAPIIARQGVLEQLAAAGGAQSELLALPSETFTREQYNLRINGDIVNVVGLPAAHSNGDSAVLFRRADVVVAGAIFDITHFPVIDLEHGGSIDGEIAAMDRVMNTLAVPSGPVVENQDGTLVIPLRGHVCNQPDLLTYRDMLYAIRARVQAQIARGRTLRQVEASDPTRGYEERWGSTSGPWTTKDFVDAVYDSLAGSPAYGAGRRVKR